MHVCRRGLFSRRMPVPIQEKFSSITRRTHDNTMEQNIWRDRLVGKILLKDNEETTLAAHEFVREKDLPRPHRVLPPNSIMTMDYRPERLNVHLDHSRRVQSINYG